MTSIVILNKVKDLRFVLDAIYAGTLMLTFSQRATVQRFGSQYLLPLRLYRKTRNHLESC